MDHLDDGYCADAPNGLHRRGEWNYRVISWPDLDPEMPEGRRCLDIRKVFYGSGTIIGIEGVTGDGVHSTIDTGPDCGTVEELLIDLKRREAAVDRPAILREEWRIRVARTDKQRRK